MKNIYKNDLSKDPREHLGTAPIPKLLRQFSIPACVGLIINGMYNIIDRIFVGQGVGIEGIAGMTIGFPIIIVSFALTLLVSVGANVLFGIRLGEKKYEEAEEFLGNGFILIIITSLIVSVICLVFEVPILLALGASSKVLPFASDYIRIILIGNIFSALSLGLNSFMRSAGAPKLSMATQFLGVVINLIFAPLFIFKFNMGIKGAAIATVMAQAASTIWCIIYFKNKKTPYHIKTKHFKIRKKTLISICKLGFSPFSMNISNSIVQVILMRMLGHYGGDTAISVIGLLFSINTVVIFPIMGITQGMQPIVSYNYGARNLSRILQAYKYSIISSTIYVALGFIVLQLFPNEIISLFNNKDISLIEIGSRTLKIFSLFFVTVGFQVTTSIFFQATNRPAQSIVLGLSRQLIFLLPAVSILPLFFKFEGIIYSFPVADVLSTILTFISINKEMKIYKRQLRATEKFIY